MNVLVLINSFRLGGAEKLVYDLVREYKKETDINIILCSMGCVETELECELFTQLSNEGIHCMSIGKPRGRGRIAAIAKLCRTIKKNHIDILHTNGQSPDFYGRIANLICRRAVVVTTIHNTKGYSRKIEQLLERFTDAYTAVSEEAKEYAISALGIKKNITVIENGIDIQKYQTISSTSSVYTVLTVARLFEQKGYIQTIQKAAPFFREHPDAIWRIVGDYSENKAYYTKVLKTLEEENIRDSVRFEGTKTAAEDIYSGANCFLLGSEYEGFGIVFVEAMAVGLPVLATRVGCLEKIQEAGGILWEIDKIDVPETLSKMYQGEVDLKPIVERNREIVTNLYSLDTIAREYINIFRKVLGQS